MIASIRPPRWSHLLQERYVVYWPTSEYPNRVVVRRHFATDTGTYPENKPWSLSDNIIEARATLPPGLARIDREREDDPNIVEIWA